MQTQITPIIKGSQATLTVSSRELFHSVGIHFKRTKGIKVVITQHCPAGTSFHTMLSDREFHLPGRMVSECFVEKSRF